jgi:hypothetical protein
VSAAVIALLAIAGGVFWAMNAKGHYSSGLVIGLIVLGFIAGIMLFTAVRTEYVVKRAGQLRRN